MKFHILTFTNKNLLLYLQQLLIYTKGWLTAFGDLDASSPVSMKSHASK